MSGRGVICALVRTASLAPTRSAQPPPAHPRCEPAEALCWQKHPLCVTRALVCVIVLDAEATPASNWVALSEDNRRQQVEAALLQLGTSRCMTSLIFFAPRGKNTNLCISCVSAVFVVGAAIGVLEEIPVRWPRTGLKGQSWPNLTAFLVYFHRKLSSVRDLNVVRLNLS